MAPDATLRPKLIVMSVEDYELLQQGLKTSYRIDNMPIEKIERIAASRMDERHDHLNALMRTNAAPRDKTRIDFLRRPWQFENSRFRPDLCYPGQ